MKRINEELLDKVVGGLAEPIYPYALAAAKKKDLINDLAKGRIAEWKTSPDKAIPSDFRGEGAAFIPSDAFK